MVAAAPKPPNKSSPKPRAIRPQRGPQEAFFGSSADIAIYGGAAGGGKSWALLADPIRFTRRMEGRPRFRPEKFEGVVMRRTSTQVTKPTNSMTRVLLTHCHQSAILPGSGKRRSRVRISPP